MAVTKAIERMGWGRVARYTVLFALLAGVYLTSRYSYNLFHGLAELFSVVVMAAVFLIAWNARRYFANTYILSLGIALVFVAGADLLHTLAYQGMNVFPDYTADLPTQLWIVARWLQTAALIAAPLLMGCRFRAGWYLTVVGAVWAVFMALVFTKTFPQAFVPGSGLTTFKVASEYAICGLLVVALGLLVWRRASFDAQVFRRLAGSIVVTIVSEILFTLYTSPFGPANLAGHLLKIVAFYLVYRAVVQTALAQPYSLLFRELKQSEESSRRRAEVQRHIADVLQEALLIMPETLPGIDYGHLYRPGSIAARVGGDFVDVFVIPQQGIGLVVGDVAGHGLEAAALTAVAKDTIKAFAFDGQSPAAAMQKTNLVALRSSTARGDGIVRFVTAFYGVLDPSSGRLCLCSAGHPPGIIRRASGETYPIEGSCPALGAFPGAQYEEQQEMLSPGDLLVLYTDGLTEMRVGRDLFGEERLLALVASLGDVPASEVPQVLFDRVTETAGQQLMDDVAILAVSLEDV